MGEYRLLALEDMDVTTLVTVHSAKDGHLLLETSIGVLRERAAALDAADVDSVYRPLRVQITVFGSTVLEQGVHRKGTCTVTVGSDLCVITASTCAAALAAYDEFIPL